MLNLRSAVNDAVSLLRDGSLMREIDIVCTLDETTVVHGDASQLQQVFCNVLTNAAQAMCGSGSLYIHDSRPDRKNVEIAIRDTGPGIDAEMVARAFKLYAQLSNSSVRKHRGMGLGLAVVQRNAIALGATIVVNSALSQGSVFIVTIPISETPALRPLSFRA